MGKMEKWRCKVCGHQNNHGRACYYCGVRKDETIEQADQRYKRVLMGKGRW